MHKKFIFSYFFILITLLMIMGMSRHRSDKTRGTSIELLAPLGEKLVSFKHFLIHPTKCSPFKRCSKKEKIEALELENQLLAQELTYLNQLFHEHSKLSSELKHIDAIFPNETKNLLKSHKQALKRTLEQLKWRTNATPARVIFRSFDSWNSSVWINIGESANKEKNHPQIAINSPVVIGKAIVGVIDYVGENNSRVCLITNSRLTPSVRAARGGEQEALISDHIETLLKLIEGHTSNSLNSDNHKNLIPLLQSAKKELNPLEKSQYLAKGELAGIAQISQRGSDIRLKGVGFNYDFSDTEGQGRDLRTGKLLKKPQDQGVSIIKVNDILVTTGTDGIFPPNFQIASVTHVDLLKEGDYFYTIECKPIIDSLEELSLVFVLPPVSNKQIDFIQP